jgi:acetyl esterase
MTAQIQLEPEAQAFADANAKPPFLFEIGVEKGRAVLDEVQSGAVKLPSVDIEDTTIETRKNCKISVRILRPQNAPATLPVIVFIHGAGWVFGDKLTHDRLIRELAVSTQAAVVFPNYSRSPEAKYPTAIEEAYGVTKWVVDHGQENGFDTERIAIAGDSVGGNMAAAVTLMSKERGGPVIGHQLLFYPVTDAAFDTNSYRQFAEGYHLRRDGMQWFWDQYTIDSGERDQITASPLRASIEQLKGLPSALVTSPPRPMCCVMRVKPMLTTYVQQAFVSWLCAFKEESMTL